MATTFSRLCSFSGRRSDETINRDHDQVTQLTINREGWDFVQDMGSASCVVTGSRARGLIPDRPESKSQGHFTAAFKAPVGVLEFPCGPWMCWSIRNHLRGRLSRLNVLRGIMSSGRNIITGELVHHINIVYCQKHDSVLAYIWRI